jgi:hypothetical protein
VVETALGDCDEHGEAVLGKGDVEGLAGIEHAGGQAGGTGGCKQAGSFDRPLIRQQQIATVVNQRGERDGVDRRQGHRVG